MIHVQYAGHKLNALLLGLAAAQCMMNISLVIDSTSPFNLDLQGDEPPPPPPPTRLRLGSAIFFFFQASFVFFVLVGVAKTTADTEMLIEIIKKRRDASTESRGSILLRRGHYKGRGNVEWPHALDNMPSL